MARREQPAPQHFFTIGHSTHELPEFVMLLQRYEIKALVDIRRFPGSRRLPQFGRETLPSALPAEGIEYHWLEVLGGRRRSDPKIASPNSGLRNDSFRAYGDYILTAEFHGGIEQLLEIARETRTNYMCAEGLYWQCHRRLVSDYLTVHGHTVEHIIPSGELEPHQLTSGAQYKNGQLTYPSADDTQRRLFEKAEAYNATVQLTRPVLKLPALQPPAVTGTRRIFRSPGSSLATWNAK